MKKTCTILFLFFVSFTALSQRSEIGPMFGTSFYLGDLNPGTLFAKPHFAGGILYRYNLSPRWALKANILFATVEGSDRETNHGYGRNLSFRSPITEISAQIELNFFRLYNLPGKNKFSPYIFTGISIFSFNPQAQLDGVYYDLQQLGTEGQGLEGERDLYSLTSVGIPFGIGFKVHIGRYVSICAEWGLRYTFTDYLDDVGGKYYDNQELAEQRGTIVASLADRSDIIHPAGSGRGNTTTKDLYSFAGLTATFKFGKIDRFCDIKPVKKSRVNMKVGKKHK